MAHSYKEILLLCKYLKNTFKMDFVVIGGAAFGIYTQFSVNDLDIVVYDFGLISEKEVDREPKRKNSFIKAHLYKVNDPITSLRYLNELFTKGKENSSYYIFDFIPFKFATLDGGWKNINTLEDYQQYKDLMRSAVYKKKT